jgi:putative oxidoreductase
MAEGSVCAKPQPALDWVYALGRIALAALFLWSGYGKLVNIDGTVGFMRAYGMPMPEVLVWIALLVELVGGALIALGYRLRWAALVLIVFTLVASFVFHAYWTLPPGQAMGQQVNFMKNIAIIGGLLAVFAHGPGRCALDRS